MQMGIVGYVREVDEAIRRTLTAADRVLLAARRSRTHATPEVRHAVALMRIAVRAARREFAAGGTVGDVTYHFQERASAATRSALAAASMRERAALAELAAVPMDNDPDLGVPVVDQVAVAALVERTPSPLEALDRVQAMIRAVDVDRADEAQAVMRCSPWPSLTRRTPTTCACLWCRTAGTRWSTRGGSSVPTSSRGGCWPSWSCWSASTPC